MQSVAFEAVMREMLQLLGIATDAPPMSKSSRPPNEAAAT
jgi:hypothetical protein